VEPKGWEALYQAGDTRWDKGAPAPGLVTWLAGNPQVPKSTVCVPGCGAGHDARAWASAGFKACGCDIAPTAIRLCHEKTAGTGLAIKYQLADFLTARPPRRFDWLFEHTLFCAIPPARRDDYVQAVLRWLKPEGQFLAIHYMLRDAAEPPFGVTQQELWERFSPHFELHKGWVPNSYPNRAGLELMLWWKRKPAADAKAGQV
jgi:SAM-dependent methyltransferase